MELRPPRLPEWYIPEVPTWILAGRGLTLEERHTLLFLWACACEAIREGREPIWTRAGVVALMEERLGLTASQAYRRLQGLLGKTLGGKRLLKAGLAQEWVSAQGGGEEAGSAPEGVSASDRGPNPRGALIGLGEAFDADLARLRRQIRIDANFASMRIPTIKEVPYQEEEDIYSLDPEKPPPPQNARIGANFRADANLRIDANMRAIQEILEGEGIFPAKAAELADLLASQGLTAEEVRRWIEAQLPEIRRDAERTGGNDRALLAWRLEQGIGAPLPHEAVSLPPLRPLTEAERAAWERAVEMALKDLPPLNRLVFERLEPIGIQDEGPRRVLGIRVPAGNLAAIRLAQSSILRGALYEAFGEIIHPVPIETNPASPEVCDEREESGGL